MRTRARTASRVVDDQPASAESRATVTFVLLALAGLIYFMWPHYFTFEFYALPTLVLGDWDDPNPAVEEPWQIGGWGELRHLRYTAGGTCTQAITGPRVDGWVIVIQACR